MGSLSIGMFDDLRGDRPQPVDRNPSIPCARCEGSYYWQDYWKPRVGEDGRITDPEGQDWLCDECYAHKVEFERKRTQNHDLTEWSP